MNNYPNSNQQPKPDNSEKGLHWYSIVTIATIFCGLFFTPNGLMSHIFISQGLLLSVCVQIVNNWWAKKCRYLPTTAQLNVISWEFMQLIYTSFSGCCFLLALYSKKADWLASYTGSVFLISAFINLLRQTRFLSQVKKYA